MRLRSLRRLEEMEIRKEHDSADQASARSCRRCWADDEAALEAHRRGARGDRARSSAPARSAPAAPRSAPRRRSCRGRRATRFIEREPITVDPVARRAGSARVRGHSRDRRRAEVQGRRRAAAAASPCQTTDRLCLFATNGRAYTLRAGDLPRGRGDGQPMRAAGRADQRGRRRRAVRAGATARAICWSPSSAGRGFVVRGGGPAGREAHRQAGAEPASPGEEAALCIPADGDHVAVVGDNRKLLVFPLDQVPELARGARRDRCSATRTAAWPTRKVFRLADGLTWRLGERPAPRPPCALARRARPGRPPAAERFPEIRQVQLNR